MNKTKILAFCCKICPFCVISRLFPESGFAKFMAKAEKNCPACAAYDEIHLNKES